MERRDLASLIIGVIVTILALTIAKILEFIPDHIALMALILTLMTTCVSAAVSFGVAAVLMQRIVGPSIDDLKRVMESPLIPLVRDSEFINRRERELNGRLVWVISLNLHNDLPLDMTLPNLRESVDYNIKRGVTYVYILPKSDENEGRVDELRRSFRSSDRNRIRTYLLTAEDWIRLPYSGGDLVIYNPLLSDANERIEGYVELPVSRRDDSGRGYWVRVDTREVRAWVARIRNIVPGIEKVSTRSGLSRRGGSSGGVPAGQKEDV
jgi:hypothetical protein